MMLSIRSYVKIGAGKAVHLRFYRKNVWHFESEERFCKICVLDRGTHRLESCLLTL
jgi:hypothetical protein